MDTLLKGFEPSEQDMVNMALAMPLDVKIAKAIEFMKTYCDGAYGCFSGGKDSCVIKQLAIDAGISVDWHYNNVTIDPPELIYFIKKHHADVKWNNPKQHLIHRMADKGCAPTRVMRWCCAEYKEQGGNGRNKIIGVRISESARRAKLWKMVVPHNNNNTLIFCPIIYWTDEDVWNYIRLRNLPYCELYDQGFARLGCVGCPLSSNGKKAFTRWPRYEAMWRYGFKLLWNRWHGIPNKKGNPRFFEVHDGPDSFFEWWKSGVAFKKDDQCVFEDMMEQYGGKDKNEDE